ncbi:tumor necrosis factor receptor superfamily member 10C [Salmo salar]|uniref:Tumor necrosis factor receptor superfamily member 10C-like n=1 Tax=Salmo salar TaxID=8030 RepID=B5XCC4_SALSA|nr:tumor necrosis factor receptor superfamily member 10C [Salmo salar]ACI68494.1 Tumor necrosis factor receptor superfamily member 11B precursor [Salmo salar]|eukprot:XP_013989210.1 PREDICTED: tumor necrosis factor receptor superfamily member 10C-like [Salmo salar]
MMILSKFWVLIYLCVFTCKGFLNAVEAIFECKKGEMISRRKEGLCDPCPERQYQAGPNRSQQCEPCTFCLENSEFISECTKTSNAICQCRTGFIRRNDESSICKCAKGSGLDTSGLICRECEEGSFTTKLDSKCVKWRECRSGVRIPGNATSDVICNDNSEPEGKTLSSTHTTSSGSIQTFSKSLIQSQRSSPHPDVPTLTPAPTIKVTKSPKFSTADFGQVMTLMGTVLLLTFLLTTVTCKLIIIPCIKNHKKPAVRTSQDSMCRRPVEESGDSSSSSLVKQPSLGEP